MEVTYMSYEGDYFRERHDYSLSDYEKSFEEIWVHDNKVYPNRHVDEYDLPENFRKPNGYIFSFARLPNEYKQIMDYEVDNPVEIEWSELSDSSARIMCVDGQTDTRNNRFTLPVIVRYRDRKFIQYDPLTRTMIVPDIYHRINEATREFLRVMKKIEVNWGKSSDTTETKPWLRESRGKTFSIIDGEMYEMNKIKRNLIDYEAKENSYKRAFEEIKDKLKGSDSGAITMESEYAVVDAAERNIGVYIKNKKDVVFSKNTDITVKKVTRTGLQNSPTVLPEEKQITTSGILLIHAKKTSDGTELFPITMCGVTTDIGHPHRYGHRDGVGRFKDMCLGSVRNDDFESLNDVEQKFFELEKAMSCINLDSIACMSDYVDERYNGNHYVRMHLELCPEVYSEELFQRYAEDYSVDDDQYEQLMEIWRREND